ncbi:MAG: putative CRISPR-associated protein [Limnoraphis robusta]|uniref:CRISPR-associated protein n=1 Tax=Limnoraphis robusta CS-951 TaxID=1637645 RepID=A0A0F5YL26_9CYAN|nr:putative CRISPR-associated protein [Limnoraphis robusta]KKD39599.1 CRISPR-associated protein [Limnoraphis robusta CS-951]
MKNTLICTVGTSLLNNLKRSEESILSAVMAKNWHQVALLLLEKANTDRLCGAEINSITSICKKRLLAQYLRLIFLVSDTEDGRNTGALLKLYYENRQNPLQFEQVEVKVLKGLRDDDVYAFKTQGLKNLVREISSEVNKWSSEAIAINATGGYKAQISFAGMIGQALEIPVYYLFEKFSEVIELPPQPIALDLAFWLNHYVLFETLEAQEILEKSLVAEDLNNPYFHTLIESTNEDLDQTQSSSDQLEYVCLSAMGILFNERSRLQFAKQSSAILSQIPQDDTPPNQKVIKLRDDHGKDILQVFSEKICRSSYVKSVINSLPFNPKQINPIRRTYSDGKVEWVLTWTDAGLGICIQTTGRNLAETNSIAIHLKEKFSN